ncbi:MAG: DUF2764 domain-containing protein [Draconibacterium sp.]|nr:DUF2764 domain-containing protein [Draconibacterium sp.]
MLKREYYCLVAGFPDLFFNESKVGFSTLDFIGELKFQLNSADYELVKLLLLQIDNRNILNLLFQLNEPFNLTGNYNQDFLEKQISQPGDLPEYMMRFLKWVKNMEAQELNVEIENKLHSLYFEYATSTKNNFLKEWFTFELNIKNVLTAFNCVQFNYPLEKHLINVGEENTVCSLLMSNRLKYEFFEEELPFADQIFRIAESDASPEEQEKTIDKIKWDYLDEQTFFHYFTIEKILSYILKLTIIERWMKLDIETGKAMLKKLVDELKGSYKFPEEFSTVKGFS